MCVIIYIMKKQLLSFVVSKPKTRAHFMLFAEDTPFKPKIVVAKNKFQRKAKHGNKHDLS